jgi:hypothetical protein
MDTKISLVKKLPFRLRCIRSAALFLIQLNAYFEHPSLRCENRSEASEIRSKENVCVKTGVKLNPARLH